MFFEAGKCGSNNHKNTIKKHPLFPKPPAKTPLSGASKK
jgi:hypothetical protein